MKVIVFEPFQLQFAFMRFAPLRSINNVHNSKGHIYISVQEQKKHQVEQNGFKGNKYEIPHIQGKRFSNCSIP